MKADIQENGQLSLRFWLKMAGIAFTSWSLILGVAAWVVTRSLDSMAQSDVSLRERIDRSIADTATVHAVLEHRITVVEDRQQDALRRLDKLEVLDDRPSGHFSH